MPPGLLLSVYCLLIVLASLLGGWLPSLLRLTHTRMQLMMSLVAGLMLGVGLLHMVPHSLHGTGSANATMAWVVAGLLTTFFLIRAFQFHQHGPAEEPEEHGYAHGPLGHERLATRIAMQRTGHDHAHTRISHSHELSWVGVTIGLALHSALDGVAVAAAAKAESGGTWHLLGLGTFLGVLLHKPLDALSVTSLMQAGGWPLRIRQAVNAAFALMCPLGALGFYLGLSGLTGDPHDATVGCALAFSAGVFICIALSDLLPELQFHAHDRVKLSLALLLGVALAWCIGFFEPEHLHGLPGR